MSGFKKTLTDVQAAISEAKIADSGGDDERGHSWEDLAALTALRWIAENAASGDRAQTLARVVIDYADSPVRGCR